MAPNPPNKDVSQRPPERKPSDISASRDPIFSGVYVNLTTVDESEKDLQ
jgi:hypothetical protein